MRVLGICGSLQKSSSNLTLLHTAQRLMPEDCTLELYDGLRSLPHFDPDLEQSAPAAVLALREAVAGSAGLLIACPEYGHSLPGALKNAIDWLIGTGELERKVVAITAATPSAERGKRGLLALQTTLGAVSARIVGGEPIVKGSGFEAQLASLLNALLHELRQPLPAFVGE